MSGARPAWSPYPLRARLLAWRRPSPLDGRSYNPDVSCDHLSHFIEVREERSVIVCEACRAELVGWRIEVSLPFFLLEQADDAHVMYHLSRERREGEGGASDA